MSTAKLSCSVLDTPMRVMYLFGAMGPKPASKASSHLSDQQVYGMMDVAPLFA